MSDMRGLRSRLFQILLFLILFPGCGESHLPTYPVAGQVVYSDGSTLPKGGWIEFTCSDITPSATARGYFGSDGRFTLTTFEDGDGAIAGTHKVFIVPEVPKDRLPGMSEAQYAAALQPISDRFKNPEASGLVFTVSPETAPHEFRIEVTRPRQRRR